MTSASFKVGMGDGCFADMLDGSAVGDCARRASFGLADPARRGGEAVPITTSVEASCGSIVGGGTVADLNIAKQ